MALWNQTTADETNEHTTPAFPPLPAQATSIPVTREGLAKTSRESVFGSGVTIEGRIEGESDIRIGGTFKGDIQIKGDVNIEKGAHLSAKVNAANVILGGELQGNVVASGQVKLLETSQMTGDLKASTLIVAAGSRMRGHVEFGWSLVEPAKMTNGRIHDVEKADPTDRPRAAAQPAPAKTNEHTANPVDAAGAKIRK